MDSPIRIVFSEKMNKSSVEEAINISPRISGSFEWENDRILVFSPEDEFDRSTTVRVFIDTEACGYNLRCFEDPFELTFRTLTHPEVAFASPIGNTLEPAAKIALMFNKSMVKPTEEEVEINFIKSDPPIEGEGKWIGSAAYVIEPTNLEQGQKYTISLDRDLKSLDGGTLDKSYSFEFINFLPTPLYIDVAGVFGRFAQANPKGPVTIYFNQRVDRDSVVEKFSLTEGIDGEEIPVNAVFSLRSSEDDKRYYSADWQEKWQEKVEFYPQTTLDSKTTYMASLSSGFSSFAGSAPSQNGISTTFTTADEPGFVGSNIDNRTKDDGLSENERAVLRFSSPMNRSKLEEHMTLTVISEHGSESMSTYGYLVGNGKEYRINRNLPRSSDFRLVLSGNAPDAYGRPIGEGATLEFSTAAYSPSVSLDVGYSRIRTFSDHLDTRIVADVTNVDNLTYNLYSLTTEEFKKLSATCSNALREASSDWPERADLSLVGSWDYPLDLSLNIPTDVLFSFERDANLDLDPGFYYLDISDGDSGNNSNLIFVVGDPAVTVKKYADGIFVWASSQQEAEAKADYQVEIISRVDNCRKLSEFSKPLNNSVLASGTTNSEGVFTASGNKLGGYKFVLVEKDGDVGVSFYSWNDGIGSYDFEKGDFSYSANSQGPPEYKAYILTDKTLYRPGDEVNYDAFIRKNLPDGFSEISEGFDVKVSLNSSYSDDSFSYSKEFNSLEQSFSDNFTIPESAKTGNYYLDLYVSKNRIYRTTVKVEEYRVPEFEVTVDVPEEGLVRGQSAEIKTLAKYFYGAPVSNASLDYRFYERKYVFNPKALSGYSFYSERRYFGDDLRWRGFEEEEIAKGSSTIDSLGTFTYKYSGIPQEGISKIYTFESDVVGESDKRFSDSSEYIVHMAEHYTGVKSQSYVGKAGENSLFDIKTIDVGGEDVPNKKVTVNVYSREYFRVKTKDNDNSAYYKTTFEDTLVKTTEVETDNYGEVQFSFLPENGGLHIIEVLSRDSQGNLSAADTRLYVSSSDSGYWERENHDRVKVVLDKDEYRVGDTAEIVTTSTLENSLTLLTVEAEGVLDYKVFKQNSSADLLDLEIRKTYAPNAYVSVLSVEPGEDVYNPPEFRMGVETLNVDVSRHLLDIHVETDQERYSPADSGKATIKVTNSEGEPVSNADLTISLVDDALLTLSPIKRADAFSHFYSKRYWGVITTQSLTASLDRINANTEIGAKGGSGSKGGSGGAYIDLSRENFSDVAFWTTEAKTDDQGYAEVQFDLPDNITRWNVFALARTAEDFGQDYSTFTTALDIFSMAALPRFVRSTDEFDLAFVVHNNIDESSVLDVRAVSSELEFLGEREATLNMEPNTESKVAFPVAVPSDDTLEEVNIAFEVRNESGELLDRLKQDLQVYPFGVELIESFSNNVKNTAYEEFTIEGDADSRFGKIEASVFGTYLSMAEDIRGKIENRESTDTNLDLTGKLLLDLYIYKYKKEVMGETENYLEDRIEKLIYSLESKTLSDGGWGYTGRSRESSIYISSYVLQSLAEASKEGFLPNESIVKRAETFLVDELKEMGTSNHDQRALIAYSLQYSGIDMSGTLYSLYNYRHGLKDNSKALLILAMKEQGGGWGNYITQLESDLLQNVDLASQRIFWTCPGRSFWYAGNDISSTSIVLRAFNLISPDSLVADLAVNYLMNAEPRYRNDTYSSALKTVALLENGLSRKVKFRPTEVEVSVQGVDEESRTKILSGELSFDDNQRSVSNQYPLNSLSEGKNRAEINLKGGGSAYYSIIVNKILPFDSVESYSNGLGIAREYFDLSGKEITPLDFEAGEIYVVRLTLATPNLRRNLVIEDYFPAGLEGVNDTFENESELAMKEYQQAAGGGGYRSYYISDVQIRKDKAQAFVDYLPAGIYDFTYMVRASVSGNFKLRSAQVFESYSPDVRGNTEGGNAVVSP